MTDVEPYYYFAALVGRQPDFDAISTRPSVMLAMAELQMQKFDGPASAPGLEVERVFYGRAYRRPNVRTAVEALAPDCGSYLATHQGLSVLRIEHYQSDLMLRFPERKAEADARPVFGDPRLGRPNWFLVDVSLKNDGILTIPVYAESAIHAATHVHDNICFRGRVHGLSHFGNPRLLPERKDTP